ncbi:hypothetical protein SDC9_165093 [bioreactor metagenome]|uniref:Uncharacterized protein n=1 Tax=bioreactor metagenome TaxID=1076179 RepID=A0A645FTF8_9ZZZZ
MSLIEAHNIVTPIDSLRAFEQFRFFRFGTYDNRYLRHHHSGTGKHKSPVTPTITYRTDSIKNICRKHDLVAC